MRAMRKWLRGTLLLLTISAGWLVSGCMPDPYAQCMKEERLKNAYLSESDYLSQSAEMCARKVRHAQ